MLEPLFSLFRIYLKMHEYSLNLKIAVLYCNCDVVTYSYHDSRAPKVRMYGLRFDHKQVKFTVWTQVRKRP